MLAAIGAQARRLARGAPFKSGDLAGALETAARAITLDLGDAPLARSAAYCIYGAALYFSGGTDEAQAAYRRAVQLAEKVGDRRARIYALGYLAMISADQGQLAEAEHQIRRASGSSTDLADEEHFVDMMVSLATAIVLDMRGEVAAAAEAADMAVMLARHGGGILEVANALLARAQILEHLGEHAEGGRRAATRPPRCCGAVPMPAPRLGCSPRPSAARASRRLPAIRAGPPVKNSPPRNSRSFGCWPPDCRAARSASGSTSHSTP